MKIGILAAGSNEAALLAQYGSFAQMTERMLSHTAFRFQTWNVYLGEFPDSADQCDGWIITGSPASVYESLPWIRPLEQLIRDIDRLKQPLVGICFGHQIIAQALGGTVEKAAVGWGLGIGHYQPTGVTETPFGRDDLYLHIIHQDQVISLPEGAEVLAGSVFCPNAILSYGRSIFTVQAHPEFGVDYMQDLLAAITPEYITQEEAEQAIASLSEQRASAERVVDNIVSVLSA